jgi:hypothetical protein
MRRLGGVIRPTGIFVGDQNTQLGNLSSSECITLNLKKISELKYLIHFIKGRIFGILALFLFYQKWFTLFIQLA